MLIFPWIYLLVLVIPFSYTDTTDIDALQGRPDVLQAVHAGA
jgi:hypothetical protein